MARPPHGKEVLSVAQQRMGKVADADELRRLQAVVFPLLYGMSTLQTAQAVGRSPRWVTMARNEFIRSGGAKRTGAKPIRNHAHMSQEEELTFLAPFFADARQNGTLAVREVHSAMERYLGRPVSLASTYNLLHRHGWRRPASEKRQADPQI
ncbi:MAG: hypothetical protein LBP61_03310 [Desulfovibrio sp.]|jgi:hypothetical protein|nr:hypothetical protein [Desulfovibrio sp.]